MVIPVGSAPATDNATVIVPRRLLVAAHACMRECGWHNAQAGKIQGDGILQAAVAEVEAQFSEILASPKAPR